MEGTPATIRDEWMRIWVELVQRKRKAVADAVASLPADSAQTIESEQFMLCFSRLQVQIADLFVREEAFFKTFGIPDSEERPHVDAHNRILDLFNDVYLDCMDHKGAQALQVFERVEIEIEQHIRECDLDLREAILIRQ
jgi:hemerythrin